MDRILVVNPNCLTEMTAIIDEAVAPLRMPGGPEIECVTLAEGPPGIESQEQNDAVVGPLVKLARAREADCAAFVIACYGDPGLAAMREAVRRPVFGIQESAILTALTLGQRFGVMAILRRALGRQRRNIGGYGVLDRLAAILPLERGIAALHDDEATFARMQEVGTTLRDTHGADVVVMGCAGMARHRKRLQAALGLPVVDPVQAAAGLALARVRLGW